MTAQAQTSALRDFRRGPWRRAAGLLCAIALVQLHLPAAFMGGDLVAPASATTYVSNSMVVLVLPAKKGEATKAAALERLLGRQVRRLEQVRAFNLSPVPGAEDAEKAAKLVEEALRALLVRTPKRATERLAAAKKLLDKDAGAGSQRLWARLFKALGLVALSRNQLVPARDMLLRSLTLFPKQTEEEYVAYGAQARELFKAVLKARASAPTGDLIIGSAAKGAEVWVDGIARGNAPTKLEELPAGDHRVMLRRSGYAAVRKFVRVLPGKAVTVDDKLKPASFHTDLVNGLKVLSSNFSQPSVVQDRIRELRNELGTDQILVLRASFPKGKTAMKGYFLAADGAFRKVKVDLPRDEHYMDKAAEFLATTAGAKLGSDPDKRPLDERKSVVVAAKKRASAADTYIDPNAQLFLDDKATEDKLTSKWWFWAAVGGGVAVVGTVVALLVSGGPEGPQGATGTVKVNLHKAGN